MKSRYAMRAAVVAATALAAFSASAFEFHGYFRESDAFNSKGGSQVCFALPGSDFKARLGNECDHYAEVSLSEKGTFQNIEWKYELMPAFYQPSTSQLGKNTSPANDAGKLSFINNNLFIQQNWGGLTFKDWGGAMLWAGQRYWRRHDVHSLDWFYWNPAQNNVGAGVEDVNLGGAAKLAVTVFRVDPSGLSSTTELTRGVYLMPEVRLYDINLYKNATLEIGVDLALANDQKVKNPKTGVSGDALGTDRSGVSPLITVQHNQTNFLGGSNTLAFQYGTGALANASGSGSGYLITGGTKDEKQWRIIEHLIVKPTPELSGALVLVYQDKSTAGTVANGLKIFSAEVRPAYHVNDWFKVAADVFYQTMTVKNAPAGTGTPNLLKATFAPTFVLGREYMSRPELRLFATYASWNEAAVTANGGPLASGAFGTTKSGATFGAQLEAWF